MNIENLVDVEIRSCLGKLKELDPASDEYKAISDSTLKLIDRKTKMEELDLQLKEIELKEKQSNEELSDKKWDHILRGVGIALPPTVALVAAFGFSVLERTEIVTSTPAREFMKRALRLS